ncbi:hypothetical protein TRFO_03121 [Tritrichomonas foetus]|uniref:Right handed beta helix domain-containing protein n=1 Tax=Tritrichomonas foetus TaxID=1144522 RepID=A0A1J4KS36_9EUKA|nr:hypothetical protein TRFO_03121 [Tritrichomonas foetus]|eukprot:OHT14105.1 hypothetical protein TRFO_03121 [Tritrichomonas foetus]
MLFLLAVILQKESPSPVLLNTTLSYKFLTKPIKFAPANYIFVDNSIFSHCYSQESGGSISVVNEHSTVNIFDVSFISSISQINGGGVFLKVTSADFTNCCFFNCTSHANASSICATVKKPLGEFILSDSTVTFCQGFHDTFQFFDGSQNLHMVNISNNIVETGSSGILLSPSPRMRGTFLQVEKNKGDMVIDLEDSLQVSAIFFANFVFNDNKKQLSFSNGPWTIKHSVFFENRVNKIIHETDTLMLFNCSFDFVMMPIDDKIMVVDQKVRDPNVIPVILSAFCPMDESYLIHKKSLIQTSNLISNINSTIGVQAETEYLQATESENTLSHSKVESNKEGSTNEENSLLAFAILPAQIILLAVVVFIIASMVIHPATPMQDDRELIRGHENEDELDQIEITSEEEEEEVDELEI